MILTKLAAGLGVRECLLCLVGDEQRRAAPTNLSGRIFILSDRLLLLDHFDLA